MSSKREYLSFVLGSELYATDILHVQEIRAYTPPTELPGSPVFIKGVLNLRGLMVPIWDLRSLLQLPLVEYTPFTVVIVLNLGVRTVGVVVDQVSDVLELDPAEIRPAPEMGGGAATGHIEGLVSVGDQMAIVVNIEKMLKLGLRGI